MKGLSFKGLMGRLTWKWGKWTLRMKRKIAGPSENEFNQVIVKEIGREY